MAEHEASRTTSGQPTAESASGTGAPLVHSFSSLPFPARSAALARYARTLDPDAYRALYRALDAGDGDDRHTALFLAVTRRDLDAVARAVHDPLLRRRALSAAIRLPVADRALEEAACGPVASARHDVYRVLRLSGRTALATRLLPRIRERYGARDATLLLPACSEETISDLLPELDPPIGVLSVLARTAPMAVARFLADRQADSLIRNPHRFRLRFRGVAEVAARRDTGAALLLLERAPALLTPRATVSALLRPGRVLDILTSGTPVKVGSGDELRIPPGPLPPAVRRALHALSPEDLRVLARRCPATDAAHTGPRSYEVAPDGLLAMLPPEERRSVVESRGFPRAAHTASVTSLAALGPADRGMLLTAWLPLPDRQTWRAARLAVALPLERGEPVLRALAGEHRSYQRAQAWPALLACAELEGDPQEFARIAQDCERAWHDQEVVRLPAVQQLAGARKDLLAALPDPVLSDVALTAVQSRDTTAPTLAATGLLLRRVVEQAAVHDDPGRAALAVRLLCQVVSAPRHRGPVAPLRVTAEAAQRLLTAVLEPGGEDDEQVLPLAELLVDHLDGLPELDDAVRRIAEESDDPSVAARAAAAWVAPVRQREDRCAELLTLDATFALVPTILRTAATRRTDLLDRVFDAAEDGVTGRVHPRATAWSLRLPPTVTGRWLPEQRRRWTRLHARVAHDESVPLQARSESASALREPETLMALARDAPQPVAAAALGALGVLPHNGPLDASGEVLDALLHHASGSGARGRAAMSALRRLLADVPAVDAVSLLTPVACRTDSPVGTRKEAVRALAGIPGDQAIAALLLSWDAPGQHRDVRAVLARILLRDVALPQVVDRLAAYADDPAVRDALLQRREGEASPATVAAYAALLARLLAEGSEDTAAAVARVLPDWMPPDAENAVRTFTATVAERGSGSKVWKVAAAQLMWLPPGRTTEACLESLFEELEARAADEDQSVRRDGLQRLRECAERLDLRSDGPVVVFAAGELAPRLERVHLPTDAARLALALALHHARRGVHRPELWQNLLHHVGEHGGRLSVDEQDLYYLGRRSPRIWDALIDAVRMLRASRAREAGLLALAVVRAGGKASAWDNSWVMELTALRAHEDPDTAMEAFLTDTC